MYKNDEMQLFMAKPDRGRCMQKAPTGEPTRIMGIIEQQ